MDRPTARWVLAVVWAGALAGVALKTLWPYAPAWVGVPIYVALGWVAVFVLPDLLHNGASPRSCCCSSAARSTPPAAVIYATAPARTPGRSTFGYHEFFHAATVLAAICHHVAIWLALFPG